MRPFLPVIRAIIACLPLTTQAAEVTLREAYRPYFHVGVAVNPGNYAATKPVEAGLVSKHFNAITSENHMKWGLIHPRPDVFDFTESDRMVDFALKNDMFITGHTLVWHSQTPRWVFEDEDGKPLTRDALLARMRDHILTVVGYYKGRVQSWDVVNEALNEDGTLRDSPWTRIIGDDFIEKAFQYAHEADPDAELYYNDYLLEVPEKCAGAIRIVKRLQAAGCRIDGVGIQGHMHLEGPSVEAQEASILAIAATGVKAMITELDVDVLPGTKGWGNADIQRQEAQDPAFNPYTAGLPDEVQQQLAERYAELFRMYLKHSDVITRVTIWGLNDGNSWLNGFPIRGRTNHALLFDRDNKAKPALAKLLDTVKEFDATPGLNPLFRDRFTADPAPLVDGDKVYLYVGHDEAKDGEMFTMNEWLCYSSEDMINWTSHGSIMRATDFKWAIRDAWAAQVVKKDEKYYLYATVRHGEPNVAMAIGVAVSDSPTGPFVDARGSALISDDMTPGPYPWDDIDPTVFIDDDGTAWMAWGNPVCHIVRLKPNMIEIDGPIDNIALPNYTEGPWLSKRNGIYYLTYPAFAHQGYWERICYATAPSIHGPWTYRGILTGKAENSYTIHPGIVNDFKGQSYLFYHNATLTLPDGRKGALGRRAVRAEYLHYNPDGTMQPVVQTKAGLALQPNPAQFAAHAPVDHGMSDRRISFRPIRSFLPRVWSGSPVCASVSDPFQDAPIPISFNNGASTLGQSFVPERDIRMSRLSLYAGDGFGTDADNTLTLALYELERGGAEDTYKAGNNLFGEGMRIAYSVQAPGQLDIDFIPSAQVLLKAGHRYVIELQGSPRSASMYWRRSRLDVYPQGAAYVDRKLFKDKEGRGADFSFAIYESR